MNRVFEVIATIAILLIATVAIAAYVLQPRLRIDRVRFDGTPDGPCAFGYRMTWIAVRAADPAAVVKALGLGPAEVANWSTGIGTVYDEILSRDRVFVSPAVNGWVFVIGAALPQPLGANFVDRCLPLLLDLGRDFKDVQYFTCHPSVDLFAWARVTDGRLVRAFAIGDDGMIWNKGKLSKDERSLGLKLFDVRGLKNRSGDLGAQMIAYPTEAHVMYLAGRWSIDPTAIERVSSRPAVGLVCRASQAWRVQRSKRAA